MDQLEIAAGITRMPGVGGLPKIRLATRASVAEIYLHGAQVAHFQKRGDAPLLFLSGKSQFAAGKAIRGGIPICFPWFGPRPDAAAHGFARTTEWEWIEAGSPSEDLAQVRLRLPETPANAGWPKFNAELLVTVSETLALELSVQNTDAARELVFENLFHAYFQVGDIGAVSVLGLKDAPYLDQLENFARKTPTAAALTFSAEVDAIFPDSPAALEIRDASLKRKIHIVTSGAHSTVVWNPWIEKSKRLADLDEGGFRKFVCVESGNVAGNKLALAPGKSATLRAEYRTEAE